MNQSTQFEVEALLARYVHCIDDGKLEEWPALFADPCKYLITSAENYERNLPIGIFIATSRGMLQDRVSALREANIYEPQRYRHLVSSVLVTGESGGAVTAQANFQVIRTMYDGTMDLFCTGKYLDRIVGNGAERKYAEKLVILDNKRIDTLLAIPL
jgi:anthranilate 1,2-dioxygenase small subunit